MSSRQPRVLLSEGSSLSSREAITALGLAGHPVEVMSSDPMCLGRFSRFVTRVHAAPASGDDPDEYLSSVLAVIKAGAIDALLPVHEQAYLCSRRLARGSPKASALRPRTSPPSSRCRARRALRAHGSIPSEPIVGQLRRKPPARSLTANQG